MPEPDQYAVMGNPVAHSKSPLIHQMFAEQCEQDLQYRAMLVATDDFVNRVNDFASKGGKGLNITVPFKQEAWALAHKRSQRAELAGAVNTLSWEQEQWSGDNTDGIGLVRDLINNHAVTLKDQRILLLGAGGAVRGVIEPLLQQGPQQIVIANRTVSKAVELAALFSPYGKISASSFEDLDGLDFDLIINGTAASLQGDVPPLPDNCISTDTVIYDMMYAAEPTAFMQWGLKRGVNKAIDGLGMLVEQAAESFYIWRKVRPQTQAVISHLREHM